MSDYSTAALDQSESRIERLGKDRESERKFLPIYRDQMSGDESVGRLTLLLHAALYNEAIYREGAKEYLKEPLVGNGICFTGTVPIAILSAMAFYELRRFLCG